DIEPHPRKAAGLQPFDQCLGVHQCSSAHINEDGTGPHQLDRLRADGVFGLWGERSVQRNHITVPQQYGDSFGIFHSSLLCPFVVGEEVIGKYSHPKAAKNLARNSPDLAGADDTGSLPVEIETYKSIEGKVQLAYAVERPMDLPVQCEQQRN